MLADHKHLLAVLLLNAHIPHPVSALQHLTELRPLMIHQVLPEPGLQQGGV
jgi:hypothetical protein